MKHIERFLSISLILGFFAFCIYNGVDLIIGSSKPKEKIYLHKKNVTPSYRHHFVILVPSYNNASFFEKNLLSIFDQDYPHFRVIYIDDASEDQTGEKVKQWVSMRDRKIDFQLIQNTQRVGALENLYRAFDLCRCDEILLFVDGDDSLAHRHVLSWLSALYDNPDVWMTYGSYLEVPSFHKGADKEIDPHVHQKGSYRQAREKSFLASHLRSGYAGLFQQIKLKDVLDSRGRFFSSSSDRAIFWPALEMARAHATYVRDVMYLYNRDNAINDDKVDRLLQIACREEIRGKDVYEPLVSWVPARVEVDLAIAVHGEVGEVVSKLLTSQLDCVKTLWIVDRDPKRREEVVLMLKDKLLSPNIEGVDTMKQVFTSSFCRYLCLIDTLETLETVSLAEVAQQCANKGIRSCRLDSCVITEGISQIAHLEKEGDMLVYLPDSLSDRQELAASLDLCEDNKWVE